MSETQKLISIEAAAKICGWKLNKFEDLLKLPLEHPKRPKYLHVIDKEYLDLYEVEKYAKRSKERQLQAPIVSDEIIINAIERLSREPETGKKDAAIISLSNFAGLRVGEIASLTIGHVVNEYGELSEVGFFHRDITKTREARSFYLVHSVVKKYLGNYLKIRLLDSPRDTEPLFVSPRGKQFDGNNLQQYMKRRYKRVGLGKLSSHSGRAATVKRCLSNGKSLKFASKVVGHTDVKTTALYDRVYEEEVLDGLRDM